jgi:hypothetical protein
MIARIDPLLHDVAVGFVALVFARSILEKGTQYSLFVARVRDYHIVGERLTPLAAATALGLEVAALLGLLVPSGNWLGAVSAIGLFTLYGVAMGHALRAGRSEIECGCGGQGQVVSWLLVIRNVVFSGIAGLVLLPTAARSLSGLEIGIVVCAIIIGWLLLATAEKSIETAATIRRLESETFL